MSVHAIVCLSCDVCGKKSKEFEAELWVVEHRASLLVRPLPPSWTQNHYGDLRCPDCRPKP